MYTRYHPIVTAFQKTVLLKSSKSTSFPCSDSSVIFSQFRHPLRRYFSGGYSRQNVPAIYPNKGANNEIQRWQIMYPHNEQLSAQKIDYMNGQSPRPYQFRHTPGTMKFPLSPSYVNRDGIAENKEPSGTITIIIDKADVVVGDNPNKDITIRVTNTPQISSKRLIERLSDAELTEMCSARCNCCQQCVQLRRNTSSQSANVTDLPVRNIAMVTPRMPRNPHVGSTPNPYIPARSFSIEGFSTVENNAKSRNVENFPKMRKMILQNNVLEQPVRPKMEQKTPLESIHKQTTISTQNRLIPVENVRRGPIIQESRENRMQRQPPPLKNGFIPTWRERSIARPSMPMKQVPQHPAKFAQHERSARNIKELEQKAAEKSRLTQENKIRNRTSTQRPSRNLVQPIQAPEKFRSSSMNRGFSQHRLPMVQSLKSNSIIQNVPFKTGGMERKSLSLDLGGNRFRSNNIRRSLSGHSQITQNSTAQLGNQKHRSFQPRPTNLKVLPSSSGPVPLLRRKPSFVNQKEVQSRNKFPNENHNLSRIPKMTILPNHTVKEPQRKLQVRSAPLQKHDILLDSVSQTTNIRHNMVGNKNFKDSTSNHVPSRMGTSMGKSIPQRNMSMNRNVNNLISRQHSNNTKQMRPAPPLHRLKSSFGAAPQTKNFQRNVSLKNLQNLPSKQATNGFKQVRPAQPLHRLRSAIGPAPQIKNVLQRSSPLNRNLQNFTNKQPPNGFRQIRPAVPLHRLGTSSGPAPQDILKRNFSFNKNLQTLMSKQEPNSHKQLRPAPPLHRLGTSFGPASQTKNTFRTNMSPNKSVRNSVGQQPPSNSKQNRPALGAARQSRNIPQQNLRLDKNQQNLKSKQQPINHKQMRPVPPFYRFAPQTNTVQRNMSMNANLNSSISRKPPNDSKQIRQPTPVHKFGRSFGANPPTNILQQNMALRNVKNDQQNPNNSQLRRAPPLRRHEAKNVLQRSKTFISMPNLANKTTPSNSKELRPIPPLGTASQTKKILPRNMSINGNSLPSKQPLNNSRQMFATPQLRTSLGSSPPNRINLQRNVATNRYTKNLPHQQKSPNLKNVRSAPTMQKLGSSLTPSKIQSFVTPLREGTPLLLPPPRPIIQQVENRQCYLQPSLPMRSISEPKYLQKLGSSLTPPYPKIQNGVQLHREGSQLLLPPPRPIIQQVENRQCYLQPSLPMRPIREPKPSIKYYEKPKFPLNTRKLPYTRVPMKGPKIENKFKPLWNKRKSQAMPEKIMEKTQQSPTIPPQKMMLRSQLRTKAPRQRNNLKDIQVKEQSMVTSSRKTPSPNENPISGGNDNPAVLLCGPQNLKLVNTPVPSLTDDKGVIIKMLYVHLTDMDAQMYASGRDGLAKLTKPTIAGKTGCGIIVDVGKKVENVKAGDKVFVKAVSCGECSTCKNGNLSLCNRVSVGEKLGLLTRIHAHPAEFVTKLPDNVNLIDSSMIGELSSAISACKRSAITAGDNVMVIDGSSLGLRTALTAKSMGATNVCLADTRKLVLEQAKKLGIDRVFLINPKLPTSYTSISLYEYFAGENPRIVFNCNGSEQTNYLAIQAVKLGGKVVLMKNDGSDQTILISDAINRDVDILTSQYSDAESEIAALKFLSAGKVPLNGVNTHIFDLSDVHEAFHFLLAPKGTTNNIFVRCNRFDESNDTKKNSGSS